MLAGLCCLYLKDHHAIEKPTPDAPYPNKLIDRVLARIDLDALTDSLTEQISQKLLVAVNIDNLVTAVLDKHSQQLQEGFAQAILNTL